MASSNEQGRGERTPTSMRTTIKSVIKALSGTTQASRPVSQNDSTAGERTNAETRSYFAEDVLRNDAVTEESSTGLQEILLSSGAGKAETPLSKNLVGERASPSREIRFLSGGGVDTFYSMEGPLPEVRSFSAGFVPPNPEMRSVPARRSLSGVFGAPEIRLKADISDPSWNRETLRRSHDPSWNRETLRSSRQARIDHLIFPIHFHLRHLVGMHEWALVGEILG